MTEQEILSSLKDIYSNLSNLQSQVFTTMKTIEKNIDSSQEVRQIIIDHFGISLEIFCSDSRCQAFSVTPRYFFFLFCKSLCESTTESIGAMSGDKDHASVVQGIKKICTLIEIKDKKIIEDYRRLLETFKLKGYDIQRVFNFINNRNEKSKRIGS